MLIAIALMGYPGAGKTTLARVLQRDYGYAIISRDIIREAMFQPCAFTDIEKDAAYAALLLALEASLKLERSCVLEGMPFSKRSETDDVRRICRSFGALSVFAHLEVTVELAQERVTLDSERRLAMPADRDWELVSAVAERFETPPENAIRLNATEPPGVLARKLTERIQSICTTACCNVSTSSR